MGTWKYINILLHIDIHLQRVKYIMNEQSMNIYVFLLFCSFVIFFFSFFLQIERERKRERGGDIKLGIRRNGLKVYFSSFSTGFLWRIFPLLRANRLYAIFSTGLKKMAPSCPRYFFCLLLPGVLGFSSVPHEPCPTTNFSYYLFPLTGRSPHFRFGVPANYLASLFFLPVSGDPSEVTEYKHLFLTVILWWLATVNSNKRIVVILFLSSQWDTTWQHQLYGYLPPITKTIQVRQTRDAEHCWRSRNELTSDLILWTPTYGRAKTRRPARTYIQQVC